MGLAGGIAQPGMLGRKGDISLRVFASQKIGITNIQFTEFINYNLNPRNKTDNWTGID